MGRPGAKQENPTLAEAISRYLRLFVLLGALCTGLAVTGFTEIVGGSALVVAAGTLALGVAGQRVIGSLLSGAVLVADPHFNIGNYIRWQGGDGGAGEVTSITLRVTRVRTVDGELVTIPNTTLTDEAVVRPYDQQRTRETEYIDIAYEADIDSASQLLLGVTDGIDAVADEPAPTVEVDELGPDAVSLRVNYWVADPRQNLASVRSAFARTVKDRLEREGIEINPATKRDLRGRIQVDGAAC